MREHGGVVAHGLAARYRTAEVLAVLYEALSARFSTGEAARLILGCDNGTHFKSDRSRRSHPEPHRLTEARAGRVHHLWIAER
jgi:hypothetical protein